MASVDGFAVQGEGGERIEIKDVPLLVGAMNAEAQALQDQKVKDLNLKKNAATKSANGDFCRRLMSLPPSPSPGCPLGSLPAGVHRQRLQTDGSTPH